MSHVYFMMSLAVQRDGEIAAVAAVDAPLPTPATTADPVGSLPRSITVTVVSDLPGRGGTGDDCLVLVLQYRVHKTESHAVVDFSRTGDIALSDCGRAAGRPLGI